MRPSFAFAKLDILYEPTKKNNKKIANYFFKTAKKANFAAHKGKEMELEVPYNEEEKEALRHCRLCPRECGVNRLEGERGFCNCGTGIEVSLVCNHKGEEPILVSEKGVCNVFFSHCNLQCVYCQNKQISSTSSPIAPYPNSSTPISERFEALIAQIKRVLGESENILGFVSPTQHIPLMKAIIRRLHQEGLRPTIIYNTNAYDSIEQLRGLENIVDVYLPDYKYSDTELAKQLSKASDYPEKALQAIKEMYRQKGNSLLTDCEDRIESGLLVRHLILPRQDENTKGCLRALCEISPNIAVSLMSQYAPIEKMSESFLNQRLSQKDYETMTDFFFSIGLHKGFFQALSSQDNYVPDFEKGIWKEGNKRLSE